MMLGATPAIPETNYSGRAAPSFQDPVHHGNNTIYTDCLGTIPCAGMHNMHQSCSTPCFSVRVHSLRMKETRTKGVDGVDWEKLVGGGAARGEAKQTVRTHYYSYSYYCYCYCYCHYPSLATSASITSGKPI